MFLRAAVIEMVAADGEPVAVAAEQKHMQIGPGEADAGRERDGAPVNVMGAVAVNEIRKARRTTDAGEGDDLLVFELALLEHLVERSRAPRNRRSRDTMSGDRRSWLSWLIFPVAALRSQASPTPDWWLPAATAECWFVIVESLNGHSLRSKSHRYPTPWGTISRKATSHLVRRFLVNNRRAVRGMCRAANKRAMETRLRRISFTRKVSPSVLVTL